MALEQSNIGINFTGGDYDTNHQDGNGFWLTVGTYSTSANIATNVTNVTISDLTLRHDYTGTQFSGYTLNVYLRAKYTLDGVVTYKYFFGDSNGASIGSKSMSGGSLTLLGAKTIAIPHNTDGTRSDLVIQGFCDAATNATYVPENTTANTNVVTLPRIPRGPRVKDNGVWRNTILYVKDNGTWKVAVPYVKDNGTWKIGGG